MTTGDFKGGAGDHWNEITPAVSVLDFHGKSSDIAFLCGTFRFLLLVVEC